MKDGSRDAAKSGFGFVFGRILGFLTGFGFGRTLEFLSIAGRHNDAAKVFTWVDRSMQ